MPELPDIVDGWRASIRNRRDFAVGLLYAASGVGLSSVSFFGLDVGTLAQMGPGFFPFWLGIGLLGVGVALMALSVAGDPQPWPTITLPPITLIIGAIVLFGLLIDRLGLALTVLAMVLIASAGSHEFSWKRALGCALVLAALSSLMFVRILGLSLPIWPSI